MVELVPTRIGARSRFFFASPLAVGKGEKKAGERTEKLLIDESRSLGREKREILFPRRDPLCSLWNTSALFRSLDDHVCPTPIGASESTWGFLPRYPTPCG